MRLQELFLFVVSASAAFIDATEEKIKQRRSVESFLSTFGFNPFTPFPDLLTTTTSRPAMTQQKDQSAKGKRRFSIFVAVEPTSATTQRTISLKANDSNDLGEKIKKIKCNSNVSFGVKMSKSKLKLSDEEWIKSILSRTTTRRPTRRPTRTTTRTTTGRTTTAPSTNKSRKISQQQRQQLNKKTQFSVKKQKFKGQHASQQQQFVEKPFEQLHQFSQQSFEPQQLSRQSTKQFSRQSAGQFSRQSTGQLQESVTKQNQFRPQEGLFSNQKKQMSPEVSQKLHHFSVHNSRGRTTNPEVEQFRSQQTRKPSALALSLFQNRHQVPSKQFPSQQQPSGHFEQTVLDQQLSHENFLQKNQHKLFAQFQTEPQSQSQQSSFQQQGRSFNSLDRNYQTKF